MTQQGIASDQTGPAADVEYLQGDTGTPAGPIGGVIEILGAAGSGISTVSSAASHSVEIDLAQCSTVQFGGLFLATGMEAIDGVNQTKAITPYTLAGKIGVQTADGIPFGGGTTNDFGWTDGLTDGQIVIGSSSNVPAAGEITSLGSSIAVTLGSNTINLEAGDAVATSYPCDSGTAIPSGNVLSVHGDLNQGVRTQGASDSIEITILQATTAQTGVLACASDAQAINGTLADKMVTPISLRAKLGDQTLNGLAFGRNSTAALGYTTALLDGQIVIGSTAGSPQVAYLTSSDASIVYTFGSNSCNLAVAAAYSNSFLTNAGVATPSTHQLTIFGNNGQGVSTSGAGSVVTITVQDSSTTGKGVVELATGAETIAGSSTTVVNTPDSLRQKLGAQTANSIPVGSGTSSAFGWTNALTAGQVVIGSGAGAPQAATLTAGSGVNIVNGNNSITISATGGGMPWVNVTGTSATMAPDTGYIANNALPVTLALPTTAAVGSVIEIVGNGAGGWLISQSSGQTLHFNSEDTTTGVTGSMSASSRYNCVTLVCTVANTDFVVSSANGTINMS